MTLPTPEPRPTIRNRGIAASYALPHLLAFTVLALCLTVPFALRSYHGDDGQFHFYSWIALRQAWLGGQLAPGWDALANFTLGDARFAFYPPVSLWLGTALSFLLPFRLLPAAFVWMALIMAGLSMRATASALLGPGFALRAALAYMVSPYLLMTALTRFAAAELLVLAWLPLIVLYFIRAIGKHDGRSALWLACLLGLSWLTNLPASIVLAYALLTAGLAEAIRRRSFKPLLAFTAVELLALMAAAFTLGPSFAEKGWITTAALLEKDFHPYLLFEPLTGFSRVNFLIGVWAMVCVEAAIIVAAFLLSRRNEHAPWLLILELAGASVLFQLPSATALWLYAPELRFVQFPFRFLAVVGVLVPLVIFGQHTGSRFTRTACAILALLALLPIVFYLRIPSTTPSNLPDAAFVLREGHPGTPEYAPLGTTTLLAPAQRPVAGAVAGHCSVAPLPSGATAVDAPSGCMLRLPVYFYPYWRATDESNTPLPIARDATGLLLVRVPAGRHIVETRFRMSSPARTAGYCTTFTALLLFLFGFRITAVKHASAESAPTRPDAAETPVAAHPAEAVR